MDNQNHCRSIKQAKSLLLTLYDNQSSTGSNKNSRMHMPTLGSPPPIFFIPSSSLHWLTQILIICRLFCTLQFPVSSTNRHFVWFLPQRHLSFPTHYQLTQNTDNTQKTLLILTNLSYQKCTVLMTKKLGVFFHTQTTMRITSGCLMTNFPKLPPCTVRAQGQMTTSAA